MAMCHWCGAKSVDIIEYDWGWAVICPECRAETFLDNTPALPRGTIRRLQEEAKRGGVNDATGNPADN